MASMLALVARGETPIGRSVCHLLAKAGYDVALTFDQDDEQAYSAAEAVREAGQDALVLGGRIGDPMVGPQILRRTRRELGTPDRLVVAPRTAPIAETGGDKPPGEAFCSIEMAHVEPVLQADLKGPLALLQAAAEPMREAGEGSAVLVATGAGLRSGPIGGPARAAAAGLARIVETAADALAPAVRVNGLVPGLLWPQARTEDEEPGDEIDLDAVRAAAPGEGDRWVRPREVAEAIVHLLEAPGILTGQIVSVDRGLGADLLPRRPWEHDREDPDLDLPGLSRRVEPPDPENRLL